MTSSILDVRVPGAYGGSAGRRPGRCVSVGFRVRPGCTERSERSLWTRGRGPEDWPSERAEEPRSLRQKIQEEHDTRGEGTAGSGTAINHRRWCVQTAGAEGRRQETRRQRKAVKGDRVEVPLSPMPRRQRRGAGNERVLSTVSEPLEPPAAAAEQEAPRLCPVSARAPWPRPPGPGRTRGLGSCVPLDKSPPLSGPQLPHPKPEPCATHLVC